MGVFDFLAPKADGLAYNPMGLPAGANPEIDPIVGHDELGQKIRRSRFDGTEYLFEPTAPKTQSAIKGAYRSVRDDPVGTASGLANGVAKGIWDAISVPANAMAGKPVSYGDIGSMAGLVTLGAGAGPSPEGALRMGMDFPRSAMIGHNGGPVMRPGVETMGWPAGSLPEYRGAAPNRTTEYPRYEPTKPTDRMARLIGSTEDPAHPIHSTFDSYIGRGQTLGGSDWYNSEEMRNWFMDQYGEGAGDTLWRDYIDTVGATSTGSDVPSNMRNASFYFNLAPGPRRAVAERVSLGGITPADAAKELGINVPNAPDNYRYGHVMQGNHAKNILAQLDGRWVETPPAGLTKGERSNWLKANPKVKGFRNDLLGSEANIAADKHFMRILAMSDGGTDFLSAQAGLSGANLERLRNAYGDAIDPYIKTRKTGTGQMVTEANLYKAAQDGVLKDTSLFKDVPQAWLDVPNANEYSSLETMAQRLSAARGMTPAQFQANLWMGAGDVTGLADESQGTFMDLFRRTLDKRARERGTDRLGQFTDFAARNSPLAVPLGVGGTATALGGGLLSRDPREEY